MEEKKWSKSLLDDISGIGEKRKKILLKSFQSLHELQETPIGVLARIEGMNQSAAKQVIQFFRDNPS